MQEAAAASPAANSLATDQVRELRAALEAARAELEGQAAELAAARRALAERDAAAAQVSRTWMDGTGVGVGRMAVEQRACAKREAKGIRVK